MTTDLHAVDEAHNRSTGEVAVDRVTTDLLKTVV
jgi:hypothetical protein